MKRGSVSWSTITQADTNGETDFGHFAIEAGDNNLLSAKLKLWNININDYAKIVVSSSADGNPVTSSLHEIVGPCSGETAEVEFPVPHRFITLRALVQEDQHGIAGCDFAILE